MRDAADAAVIGGGPAGCAVARLLASWGHRVVLIAGPVDRARGLAESIPPSTHKLLAAIGVLEDVERAGFYRSTGNTVWWASPEPRVESFGAARGYQVFRPDLDAVLLASAVRAGAVVHEARVRSVECRDDGAVVRYEKDGRVGTFDCRVAVDCSGRAGVIARQFRRPQPGHRTHALVGVWQTDSSWDLSDATHTVVETFEHGWAWSIPIAEYTRQIGLMLDATSPRPVGGPTLAAVYRDELAETAAIRRLADRGSLQHVFACDASLYRSERYAGPSFLLAGDAGSAIDPLSSFGVKKALASAWVGGVAAHTTLLDPARRDVAFEFFNDWERRVYDDYLRRSREFSRAAHAHHAHPFWASRADVDVPAPENPPVHGDEVRRAFDRIRSADALTFTMADGVQVERRPVIRGSEIQVEESFSGLRFHEHVDLVALADVACRCRSVPAVYDAYCRTHAPTPLPNLLSGLSLLVATGVLQVRTSAAP